MLLPRLTVKKNSGRIHKLGDSRQRLETTIMDGKAGARRADVITRSNTGYLIEHHGLEGVVTKQDKKNAEKPYDAEKDEVLGLSTALWISKEKSLADTMADDTVLTNGQTLVAQAQFSDYVNSDPLGVFKTARSSVRNGSGVPPDTAWCDWDVAQNLAYHPGILDALGYTANRAGQLTEQELAKALGVQRLLIAQPQFNSATEGAADVRANIWGKHIWFGVMPKRPMKYQVSGGYYLIPTGQKPRQVFKEKIINPPGATSIIVTDSWDMLISNVSALYFIQDAIA